MRPDVALAFDRLDAAAQKDGVALLVSSGYRSDAEQARLFVAHPDPKWVAPPGQSLHRFGTELDLGPSSAYGWLAANARRFGFVQRYSCERWLSLCIKTSTPELAKPAGPGGRTSAARRARTGQNAEILMARFPKHLPGLHAMRHVRVTVAWQRGRVRRIRLEYERPHLVRRLINAVRW
jgi:hypothetical protein